MTFFIYLCMHACDKDTIRDKYYLIYNLKYVCKYFFINYLHENNVNAKMFTSFAFYTKNIVIYLPITINIIISLLILGGNYLNVFFLIDPKHFLWNLKLFLKSYLVLIGAFIYLLCL